VSVNNKLEMNRPLTQEEATEQGSGEIPVKDKRRFNERGERIAEDPASTAGGTRSPRESDLEAKLRAETERREAAEAKLVSVQAKFDEARTGLEKETAEMRARMAKSLEERARASQYEFLTSLLPVLDNLNRAVEASENDPSLENLREGVKGTARSFEQALLSVGVEAVPAVGEVFDPELHEAIDMAEVDADQDGRVIGEYARGYRFGERLLRPARVQVGRARTLSAGE
jgi:molecular chaperone GrpE